MTQVDAHSGARTCRLSRSLLSGTRALSAPRRKARYRGGLLGVQAKGGGKSGVARYHSIDPQAGADGRRPAAAARGACRREPAASGWPNLLLPGPRPRSAPRHSRGPASRTPHRFQPSCRRWGGERMPFDQAEVDVGNDGPPLDGQRSGSWTTSRAGCLPCAQRCPEWPLFAVGGKSDNRRGSRR